MVTAEVLVADIVGALALAKGSMDVLKALMEADKAIDQATLKLRLADVMSNLADVRMALVDATEEARAKDDEIKVGPVVCLAFADTDSNTYLSITGGAEVLHDVGKAEESWSNEAQAWWPKGPTDPEVRVLRVVPDNAEFWDTRGNSITVALKLAAARMTGQPPDLGENKNVRMT